MTKIATRIVAAVYAAAAIAVGGLALFGVSVMMQPGPHLGPGDLAVSMMPTAVLLASCAVAQFRMTTLSGLALGLAISGFATLAVVWISHLGGGIYEVAGVANLVIAIGGLVFAYRVARGIGASETMRE